MTLEPSDRSAFTAALDLIERDSRADRWRRDPVAWVEERLGEHVWSKQAEVMRSVANNPLVTVQSAHSTGKSHLASRLVAWFLSVYPPESTFCVTSAPTASQVRAILWRYITQVHQAHNLVGRVTQAAEWKINDQLVAFGRKPNDYTDSSFSGVHAENLLVILDEACGVPKSIWVGADSLATSANSHTLAIGNPDNSASHFARVCQTEPGWVRHKISALETPNVTGEPVPDLLRRTLVTVDWIEDKRRRWGESNPLFKAKVLGEFADGEDGLIPLSWVKAANDRWNEWNESPTRDSQQPPGRRLLGVDVGHLGEDSTVIATRQGHVVQQVESWSKLDTVAVTGLVEARLTTPHAVAVVDAIGVGAGVVDLLRAHRKNVQPFVASASTKRRDNTGVLRFANVRSAAWWHARELLDPALGATLALPPDDDLTADLTTPRWEDRTGGVIFTESKDSVRRRLGRSTDFADAVVAALWVDAIPRASDGDAPRPRARAYAASSTW